MENFVEHQTCISPPASASRHSSSLSFHKSSHTISKIKPKVRIIHIFAPEIIKTDVADFRELVQRLTGKPTARDRARSRRRPKRASEDIIGIGAENPTSGPSKRLMELRRGREEKDEEEVWWVDDTVHNGGYLNAFGDFDHQLSFLPNLDGFAAL